MAVKDRIENRIAVEMDGHQFIIEGDGAEIPDGAKEIPLAKFMAKQEKAETKRQEDAVKAVAAQEKKAEKADKERRKAMAAAGFTDEQIELLV